MAAGHGYGPCVLALFPGEPEPLPERVGSTWAVRFDEGPPPAPVRHALGYAPFVHLAATYGTDPRSLFDIWAFAHFVRAHRDRLTDDAELLHSAVVFLGNVFIANHPECFWTNNAAGLAVESERGPLIEVAPGVFDELGNHRYIRIGGTVPAVLAADEARFLEFQTVVDNWKPGAPVPATRRLIPARSQDPASE